MDYCKNCNSDARNQGHKIPSLCVGVVLLFQVPVTVHREQRMKREKNQHDATIRCLLLTSVSTCFGQHYVHLQENKEHVLMHTVYCAGSAECGW